jgi:hypothetical protein
MTRIARRFEGKTDLPATHRIQHPPLAHACRDFHSIAVLRPR